MPALRRQRSALLCAAALTTTVALLAAGCGDDSPSAGRRDTAGPAAAALVSRSDLRPPSIDVRRSLPGQAPGLIFIGPKKVFGAKHRKGEQSGPMIIDDRGRVRWFKPMPDGQVGSEVRVQRYRGRPVLTWWQGRTVNGTGKGVGVIADTHYRRIATVKVAGGLKADFHEFQLTPQGTALMLAFHRTTADLSSVGGPKHGKVVEGVVQEVDVRTGRLLMQWRSLDDVPVKDSYEPLGARSASAYDYFHINSADLDEDGNVLVSARHTWAVYKIDRKTGGLIWTLGGKASDFRMGPGAQTAWQHDAKSEGGGVIRIFDNGAGDSGAKVLHDRSRVIRVRVDRDARTATLLSARSHPQRLSAGTQGNGQLLPDGHLFVGWGSKGVFSEFAPGGRMLFDARVERGYDTYRAYRYRWTGRPATRPSVAARARGGRTTVDASWNGSTEVTRWEVLGGASRSRLHRLTRAPWRNLETAISAPGGARYVAVRALDDRGRVLGTSPTVAVRRP